VLKSYYRKRYEPLYDNEIKALTMLMNTPSPHVISYFGSFRQQDSYNIILEFADGGNLNEYFRDQKPPQTPADIVRFWRSLFDVLKGLDRVHQLMNIEESCIRG
jgi:serine/threonine protein kinase